MSYDRQVSRALDDEHRANIALFERVERALAKSSPDPGEVAQLAGALCRQIEQDVGRHFDFEERELFPRMTDAGDGDMADRAVYQAFITAIALPAGIGAALIADPMVRLLMGEKWAPAIFVIQALGPVFALQTIGQFAQPLGMALGQTRLLFVRDLQMFFIRLPIIIVCTIMFGLTGLVLGRSFAGLFGIVFNVQLVKRFVGVGILAQFAVNGRALLSAAVMSAGTIALAYIMPAAQSRSDLILEVAARVVTAGILFCGTMIGSWLLLDRPIGPENELLRLWRQFAGRNSKPSAAPASKTEETPSEAAVKHSADQ